MNGAHALIRTLVANGVDVCFANPGTSEMQFVAALDDVPEMRAVLALFEGVATGAADGYGRMTGTPAATLLHLGPGLGNGIANLHNARRARTPIVNIVGDQATYHRAHDAPLTSDIESLARNVSGWIRDTTRPESVASDAADAVVAARTPPGQIATLILPADTTWLEAGEPATARALTPRREVAGEAIDVVAKALRTGEPSALLLGGAALQARGLLAASRVAEAVGAKLLGEVFPARLQRGAGLPAVERLGYFSEFAMAQLQGVRHLVLVDTKAPVSFFAYPDKPTLLVPEACEVHTLALDADDVVLALEHLAGALGADPDGARLQPGVRPAAPTGALTAQTVADALGAILPEGAIVADEAQTGGLFASGATAGAPRHDWLTLTGGAIGQGMPLATGAAIACPDRKVINLEADGSAMYTMQALWSQAREGLDVTTILFDNRSYAILNIELGRVGAGAGGPRAQSLLDLSHPDLDFVALARGMGVEATRPENAEDLTAALKRALHESGPHLIDVPLPSRL
jgi:acetolactate synthase I/II/III large subunit